jgi:hypothetical protein
VEEAIGRPNMVKFAAKVAAATTFEEMQNVINESVSEIGLMEFMRLTIDLVVSEVLRRNELQAWFLSEHLVDTPLVHAEPIHAK